MSSHFEKRVCEHNRMHWKSFFSSLRSNLYIYHVNIELVRKLFWECKNFRGNYLHRNRAESKFSMEWINNVTERRQTRVLAHKTIEYNSILPHLVMCDWIRALNRWTITIYAVHRIKYPPLKEINARNQLILIVFTEQMDLLRALLRPLTLTISEFI